MSTEYDINSPLLYMKRMIDEHKNKIAINEYYHCIYIIEQFYNWYYYNFLSADDLYALIDYNDNLEVDSISNFAESYKTGTCEETYYMWEIILMIFMVIVYIAYKKENKKYIPQDIEVINPTKIGCFFKQIETGIPPKELYKYFCKEVCY